MKGSIVKCCKNIPKKCFVEPWLHPNMQIKELRDTSSFIRNNIVIVYKTLDQDDKSKIKNLLKHNSSMAENSMVDAKKDVKVAKVGLWITGALCLSYFAGPMGIFLQFMIGPPSMALLSDAKTKIQAYKDLIDAYDIIKD